MLALSQVPADQHGHLAREEIRSRGLDSGAGMQLRYALVQCTRPKPMLRLILYIPTITVLFGLGFYETRLKNQLIDKAEPHEPVTELSSGEFSRRFRRQRILDSLPRQAKARLRGVATLKFLFFFALIAEVLILQR